MRDQILTHREMCDREGVQTLQRGMNFRMQPSHSVVLMSRRSNAPYRDKILPDGETIEYEGHDVARTQKVKNPKVVDQEERHPSGNLTQNGHFVESIRKHRRGESSPEVVQVYEKLFDGVWSDKGLFHLIDYRYESTGKRKVFKFLLKATEYPHPRSELPAELTHNRLIPSEIKKQVWKRDKGRCVLCGARDNLHFDHDIPFSKGGASISLQNVRILCARHNIQKRDKIE